MITVSFCIEDTVVQVNQDNQSNGLNQLHTHGGRISAMILLLRSDVKQSATIFRHNVRQIRHWLEEESASAAKEMERAKPKEMPGKDAPKEEKHSREGEPKKPCVQRKPCVLGTSRWYRFIPNGNFR
ncbi:uncharacterized protein [Coffea arabica]|uniref:Uncharacterized protein isoform X2 n=1 Tax=Coffea arabica TaxID=13443 RepID=A0ABM4WIW8_COFAR|nr:uncharacterized protein LOC113727103 isoform X2 [Coffea arabica]